MSEYDGKATRIIQSLREKVAELEAALNESEAKYELLDRSRSETIARCAGEVEAARAETDRAYRRGRIDAFEAAIAMVAKAREKL